MDLPSHLPRRRLPRGAMEQTGERNGGRVVAKVPHETARCENAFGRFSSPPPDSFDSDGSTAGRANLIRLNDNHELVE
jgi:hypothetical protein